VLLVLVLAVSSLNACGGSNATEGEAGDVSSVSRDSGRLLGVGADQRSVVIEPRGSYGACVWPEARAAQGDRGPIRVRVRQVDGGCSADRAVAFLVPAITAPVDAARPRFEDGVTGESGDRLPLASAVRLLRKMPQVVPLRFEAACELLRFNGFRQVYAFGGSGERDPIVTGQRPDGWSGVGEGISATRVDLHLGAERDEALQFRDGARGTRRVCTAP